MIRNHVCTFLWLWRYIQHLDLWERLEVVIITVHCMFITSRGKIRTSMCIKTNSIKNLNNQTFNFFFFNLKVLMRALFRLKKKPKEVQFIYTKWMYECYICLCLQCFHYCFKMQQLQNNQNQEFYCSDFTAFITGTHSTYPQLTLHLCFHSWLKL